MDKTIQDKPGFFTLAEPLFSITSNPSYPLGSPNSPSLDPAAPTNPSPSVNGVNGSGPAAVHPSEQGGSWDSTNTYSPQSWSRDPNLVMVPGPIPHPPLKEQRTPGDENPGIPSEGWEAVRKRKRAHSGVEVDLLPLNREILQDRGRGKTRINADPGAHVNLRTLRGAEPISLPPVQLLVRGSKEKGVQLPGISSIFGQSELPYERRPARRLSESSPRVYSASDLSRSTHSPNLWPPRQARVDSISTAGTDVSLSRPSSPDTSALASSTSSLSSIFEDRTSHPSQRSLENEDTGVSVADIYAPSSVPADVTGDTTHLSASVEEDRVMDDAPADGTYASPPHEEKPESRLATPTSIKSEPETDSAPNSPRSKGISESGLFGHEGALAKSQIPEMQLDTQTPIEQRDEQMACTPTQPGPKHSLPWMD
ncbi:unnamed protein product, partial [Rhizoctonia solani]